MSNLIRWRVVLCDSVKDPVLEVLAEGESDIHDAMSLASHYRETVYGPEAGIAVEWAQTAYGFVWLRYAYFITDLQRELMAELERRERLTRLQERAAAIEKKFRTQKRDRIEKRQRRLDDKRAKHEEYRARIQRQQPQG